MKTIGGSERHTAQSYFPTTHRLRSRSRAASETATELGLELSGSATLGLLAALTATVALAVATAAAATAGTPLGVAAEHAAGRSVRALLLDVRLGHDLGGEVEPLAEVVEALGGEGVVVPLPGEAGLQVAAGGERLACGTVRRGSWEDMVGRNLQALTT